jgi:thioesterase domain-containing protein
VRDVGESLARPVAQIAREHVAALRAARPRGPYALLGWSFGGMVAVEMAVQLQAAGEEVSFVGLLDTIAPDVIQELEQTDDELMIGLAGEAAESWGWTFAMDPAELAGVPQEEKPVRVFAAMRAQGPVPEDFGPGKVDAAFRAVSDRVESTRGYLPGRFRGTVTLFRASEPYAYREALFAGRTAEEEHVLGWGRWVDGAVEVHFIPGSHVTMASEPHVRVLAERLRACLHAAAAPAPAEA